jgi:hypothetical protein
VMMLTDVKAVQSEAIAALVKAKSGLAASLDAPLPEIASPSASGCLSPPRVLPHGASTDGSASPERAARERRLSSDELSESSEDGSPSPRSKAPPKKRRTNSVMAAAREVRGRLGSVKEDGDGVEDDVPSSGEAKSPTRATRGRLPSVSDARTRLGSVMGGRRKSREADDELDEASSPTLQDRVDVPRRAQRRGSVAGGRRGSVVGGRRGSIATGFGFLTALFGMGPGNPNAKVHTTAPPLAATS